MEASGPENGERRARRTGILIGLLVAAVIGLGVALALVLAGDDDNKKDEPITTPTSATTQTTQTTDTTITTTPPTTTTTTPSTPTISQTQAKAAAQRGASASVVKFGITIPPSDWDARCTAVGGTDQAATWGCQVAANSGQCSGSITAFARAAGVAGTRNAQVGCGE
jgi:cytoskeletal protein RodZ